MAEKEKETAVIRVLGDVSDVVLHAAAERISATVDEPVRVEIISSGAGGIGAWSPPDLLAIGGVIALIVRSILAGKTWIQARSWTDERLRSAIGETMQREGVSDYSLASIKNSGCLHGEPPCPCVVSVRSSGRTDTLEVHIFRDGTTFTFRIASA